MNSILFVSEKIESGRSRTPVRSCRAALRTLEREESQFEAKLVALRQQLMKGDTSGVPEGDSFRACSAQAAASVEAALDPPWTNVSSCADWKA